jgi:hypothetical protein
MLQAYETKYESLRLAGAKDPFIHPITSKEWEQKVANLDLTQYKRFSLWNGDFKPISQFKPSDLLCVGDYPFSNFEENQVVITAAGNFYFFDSNDDKMII